MAHKYVKYNVAELLKLFGFNENCGTVYSKDKQDFINCVENIPGWEDYRGALNEQLPEGWISCPSLTEVCDWLRKKKNLYIHADINYIPTFNKNVWMYVVKEIRPNGVSYSADVENESGQGYTIHFYDEYEEAIEAGILFTLTKILPKQE